MRIAGYAGLTTAAYIAATCAAHGWLATGTVELRAVGVALLAAWGTVLLDRVKATDALLDPADAIAAPERQRWIRAHRRALRGLVVATGLAAAGLAWTMTPLAALLAPSAWAGVVAYAPRPADRGRRPKDVFLLKNAIVAASIVGLAVVLERLARGAPVAPRAEMASAVFLALVVFGDAALCDLDDVRGDRASRTATLPTRLGTGWTVAVALALRTAGWAVLVATLPGRVPWTLLVLPSVLVAAAARARRRRDVVDLGWAITVVAVIALA